MAWFGGARRGGVGRGRQWRAEREVKQLKKRLLIERGVLLANGRMVGYELADPDRQLGEAGIRERRAGRHRRKALKAVEALPSEECDFHQQRKKAGLTTMLEETLRQSREAARRIAFLMRPTPSQAHDRPHETV